MNIVRKAKFACEIETDSFEYRRQNYLRAGGEIVLIKRKLRRDKIRHSELVCNRLVCEKQWKKPKKNSQERHKTFLRRVFTENLQQF